jgi:hypothetical protein
VLTASVRHHEVLADCAGVNICSLGRRGPLGTINSGGCVVGSKLWCVKVMLPVESCTWFAALVFNVRKTNG